MSKKKKWIIFLIPILLLIGMAVMPIMTILFGKEVYLTTEPVDPRDLFRGDYVTLQYDAERVPSSVLEKEVREEIGRRESNSYLPVEPLEVYAVLKKTKAGTHEVVKVVEEKPSSGLYLKGEMESLFSEAEGVSINYNLNNYFVPENTGGLLEDAMQTTSSDNDEKTNVIAVVKVFKGHSVLSYVQVKK